MGSSRNIFKGVVWTFIYNIINGLYGFFSVPLLIAYYGKANYGLIGLAMSVNVYLRLMDLGFNSTNVRFYSNWLAKNRYEQVKSLFQTSLIVYGLIGIVNAFILVIVAMYAQEIFHINSEQYIVLRNLLFILALSAILNWIFSCYDQVIRAHEEVGWIQKMMFIPKLLQVVVLVLTLTLHFKIEMYYGLTVFSLIAIVPFVIAKINKLAPYLSFVPKFNKNVFTSILPYCLNIFSFGIFQFSMLNLRPVFLGLRGSIESVADYRIINSIVSLILLIGGGFISIILPSASKVVSLEDKVSQQRIAYDATKYITILLAFLAFAFISVSHDLLVLYVGADYLYLNVWLNIWLLATLFSHNQAISSLILAGSDIKEITYMTIFSSIVGLIICWILIPRFQVGGTVLAYFIYGLLQLLFYYLYYWPKKMHLNSWRIFSVDFFPAVILGCLSCVAVRSVFSVVAVGLSEIVRCILCGGMFALLYWVLIYLFILNDKDKDFMHSIIKK